MERVESQDRHRTKVPLAFIIRTATTRWKARVVQFSGYRKTVLTVLKGTNMTATTFLHLKSVTRSRLMISPLQMTRRNELNRIETSTAKSLEVILELPAVG